ATWFTPENDACTGKTSSTSARIAAVSTNLYGDTSKKSQHCGQCAKVTGPSGKSTTVTITDACPTCENNSLDLTKSAFADIADLDAGLIDIKW
ncbi:RlpA-like double-psi beta-barrel-protein domain-containing protein-containing protein, partial [Thamnocephalis sphaerospora]